MMLTEEQRTSYWQQGFLAVQDVLDADEVAALRKRTEQIILGEVPFPQDHLQIEPELEGQDVSAVPVLHRLRKLSSMSRFDPVFAAYTRHPKIVAILCDLLGPDIKFFADQIQLKPPFHGSAKPYHQDSPYWPIEPMELITCWMALDDATVEN